MLQHHLALAERHAALSQEHVARQRELVARLERDGHSAQQARALLATFEQILHSHEADRDRLRDELLQR